MHTPTRSRVSSAVRDGVISRSRIAQIAPPRGKESAGPEGATARGPNISGSLDAETVASMSEEQREQLRRLKAEAQRFGRSVLEGADESGNPDADEASRRT